MSYIALARKWRPKSFSQLVGQDAVNKALINSLNQQRIHHAYLFTGTRGVGKTSIARLLAKALNCEQGISAEPCLQCDTCLAVEQGHFMDLIEVDGASRTRVEDTRELLENVQYSPTNGRFKIYLIDEVHMLSQHSFNALLKTLEEPPQHVKFLLATTDPQKLPITVLSRCLQFNLKPLQIDTIVKQLNHILDAEDIPFDAYALQLISQAARGSMRDALSLLDQTIACSDSFIEADTVKNILGLTKQDYALQILHALAEFNPQAMLSFSREIALEGGNFQYVLDELLNHLHQLSIAQALPCDNPLITPSEPILDLSTCFSAEDTQLFYQIALKGKEELKLAPSPAIGFEMTLLRLYTFKPESDVKLPTLAYQVKREDKEHTQDLTKTSSQDSELDVEQNHQDNQAVSDTEQTLRPRHKQPIPTHLEQNATKEEPCSPETTRRTLADNDKTVASLPAEESNQNNNHQTWQTIINRIKLAGLSLSAAEQAEMTKKEEARVFLSVDKGHRSLFTASVINRIESGLSDYFKEDIKIHITTAENIQSSPAQKKQIFREKQQQKAEQALQNDSFFQNLKKEFSAELVKNSIELLEDDL